MYGLIYITVCGEGPINGGETQQRRQEETSGGHTASFHDRVQPVPLIRRRYRYRAERRYGPGA
jgi:hypothetical protein